MKGAIFNILQEGEVMDEIIRVLLKILEARVAIVKVRRYMRGARSVTKGVKTITTLFT